MYSFEDLISRAEQPLLDALLPSDSGPLARRLDPKLMSVTNLSKLLLGLVSPQTLLLDPLSREKLLEIMPSNKAEELVVFLGGNISGTNPFSALRGMKFSSASEKERLLNYFGLEFFPEQRKEKKQDKEVIGSEYPLFPHQISVLQEVRNILSVDGGRVLLHMPTGSGKTRTAINYAVEYLREQNNRVVVWLANSEELCEQAFEEFKKAWQYLGNRNIAALRFWDKNEADLNSLKDGFVVIGLAKGFATLANGGVGIRELSTTNPLVIFDEAHQVIAPTYRQITELLLRPLSSSKLLGLSATPGRTWNDPDKDEELSSFFYKNKVTLKVDGYSNPVSYLIENGYLAKPSFKKIYSSADIELTNQDKIKLAQALDISQATLNKLGLNQQRNLLIVDAAENLLKKHSRVILFASSVAQSDLIASVLSSRGANASSVTSNTGEMERARAIKDFKSDSPDSRVLCNFGILTTGFDAPKTSAALIARPTLSLVLYSQMIGRALRGVRAGGNSTAEIITVIDEGIKEFNSVEEAFSNWEDVWKK